MPRSLKLSLDGKEFSVQLKKIDRDDLYGSVEIEAFDEKANPAQLLVRASDGKNNARSHTAAEQTDAAR